MRSEDDYGVGGNVRNLPDTNVISEVITRQYAIPRLFLFDQIIAVYRQQKRIFWIVLIVGCVLSILIGYSMPTVYNSTVIFESRAANASPASSLTSALGLTSDPSNEITLRLASANLTRSFIIKEKILEQLKKCPLVAFLTSCPKTLDDAVVYFNSAVRSVGPGQTSDSFQLVVSWKDGPTAAAWANGIVTMLNDMMRNNEIRVREAEVQNYASEVAKLSMVQVQPQIYSNLAAAESALVVARSTPDYGVTVIDPGFPPPHGGHQAFIKVIVAGAALSLVLSILAMYLARRIPLPRSVTSIGTWAWRLQEKWRKAM
ncbi:MAG TPA: hypothetical protein VHW02_06890 [Rhizomicrobium sp.]|jgi:hypothetical protein|nr:hypothetical protein [Rhizomicrobium sp.]